MRKIDLTNKRFGSLVVLYESKELSKQRKQVMWHCKCDCGKEIDAPYSELSRNRKDNCGCLSSLKRSQSKRKRLNKNKYDLSGSYGIGYTNKGDIFYFDIEDYDLISPYCWRKRPDGYLDAKIPCTEENAGSRVLMHDMILNSRYIDHQNGVRHDNRKQNLRKPDEGSLSFDSYNQMNKGLQRNNKSTVAGVCWHSRDEVWESHISIGNKLIYLGRFENFEDAVKQRKEAEKKYFGDWAFDQSQTTEVIDNESV